MATQGNKRKYRGYAYVKDDGSGGGVDENKVKEIINSYIEQTTGTATDKIMSQDAVTKAIQDTDVGTLKTRMDTAENNIITNTNNINTNITDIANNKNQITINTTNITTNAQSIRDEATTRKNTDDSLQVQINNEATTREEKDNELLGKININKGNIEIVNNSLTVLQDKVNTHISEYEENVRMIQTQITNESNTRATKDSELEAKIAALQADIKVEVVDSEPSTPVNNTMYFIKTTTGYSRKLYNNDTWYDMGDTEVDLSNYYKKSETYSQEQLDDKITFINGKIATEQTTRANADTALLNTINNEINSRATADNTLQENIDKKQNKLTGKNGIQINSDDTIEVDLSTIVDKLYPIGYVLVANQAPGLGTWTDITDSYTNRYLRLGSYGELSDEKLPVPDLTVTINSAGAHTHKVQGSRTTSFYVPNGSFYGKDETATVTSSSAGEHTHTATIGATAGGVYQDGAAVQPLGFGIRIFQRTA